MIRQFAGRASGLVRSWAAAAALVALSTVGAAGQTQVPEGTLARSVILSLYSINAMMEQQGAGLKGGAHVMTPFRAFLAPELIKEIAASDGGFRPLVGAREGTVDDYELRMAEDQPDNNGIVFEAAVESRGTVRLISFALTQSGGRALITRIWGDGWSFGKGSAEAAQPAPDANAQPPGKEKQRALAAADEGDAAAGNRPVGKAALSLPFQDAFDGTALGPRWSVIGENRDKFVIEDGVVYQIATGGDDDFRKEGSENIFRLDGAPDGDFDMTLTGKLEAKTGREGVWLGLYEASTSFLAANLYVYTNGCGPYLGLWIVNRQPVANRDEPLTSEFDDNLFDKGPVLSGTCNAGNREIADTILRRLNEAGFSLTLSRRGFRYFATAELDLPAFGDNPGGPLSAMTNQVARTTTAGDPAFMLGQFRRAGNGESVAQFDSFSISAPVN